jgi:hypothetical protein
LRLPIEMVSIPSTTFRDERSTATKCSRS